MSEIDSDDVQRLLDSIDSGDYRFVTAVDVLETIRGLCVEAFSNYDELHDQQDRIQEIYARVPEEGELDPIIDRVNALLEMDSHDLVEGIRSVVVSLEEKNSEFAAAQDEAAQYLNA